MSHLITVDLSPFHYPSISPLFLQFHKTIESFLGNFWKIAYYKTLLICEADAGQRNIMTVLLHFCQLYASDSQCRTKLTQDTIHKSALFETGIILIQFQLHICSVIQKAM